MPGELAEFSSSLAKQAMTTAFRDCKVLHVKKRNGPFRNGNRVLPGCLERSPNIQMASRSESWEDDLGAEIAAAVVRTIGRYVSSKR